MTEIRLTREHAWEYSLSLQEPRLEVPVDTPFVLETNDAFNGAITTPEDLFSPKHMGDVWFNRRINPLSGPVAVTGAKPGDVLVVDILDIIPAAVGFVATEEDRGPFMHQTTHPEARETYTKIIRHLPGPSGTTSDGIADAGDGVTWPLAPMIGCIGTVPLRPEQGSDSLGMQSRFGGNLDVTEIKKGNKLYLPVAHDGGLLYAGDVHASQATEFQGTANEAAAEVVLSCSILSGKTLPFARVETPTHLIQLASQRPWEEAVKNGFFWLLDWLVEDFGMPAKEAVLHFNANPGVQVRVYSTSVEGSARGSVGVAFPKAAIRTKASR